MLPTKFRFIWPSGFREDFKKSANSQGRGDNKLAIPSYPVNKYIPRYYFLCVEDILNGTCLVQHTIFTIHTNILVSNNISLLSKRIYSCLDQHIFTIHTDIFLSWPTYLYYPNGYILASTNISLLSTQIYFLSQPTYLYYPNGYMYICVDLKDTLIVTSACLYY